MGGRFTPPIFPELPQIRSPGLAATHHNKKGCCVSLIFSEIPGDTIRERGIYKISPSCTMKFNYNRKTFNCQEQIHRFQKKLIPDIKSTINIHLKQHQE